MDPELVNQQEEERKQKDPSAFNLGYERNEADYYPTPKSLRCMLTENFGLHGPIWEPCSGGGHLAKHLENCGHVVLKTDIRPTEEIYGHGGIDFLHENRNRAVHDDFLSENNIKSIVTNPPFSHLTQFMERGLEYVDSPKNPIEQLILLARQDHHFSAKRNLMFARSYRAVHSTWRALWIPTSKGNPRWSHVWWEWRADYNGPPQMMWAQRTVAREDEFTD